MESLSVPRGRRARPLLLPLLTLLLFVLFVWALTAGEYAISPPHAWHTVWARLSALGPDAMREALGADAEAAIEPRGEKAHVDLKLLNRIWLQKAGVQVIDVSPDCTMCHPDRFWSHRVTGGARGSQAAIIRLKGGAAQ